MITLVGILDAARWPDVLDVVVVSLILYGAIAWIRRSASSNMVVACIGLGLLYLLAREFDLYLTRSLLQAVLAVAVIAVVIVFQDDIRRLLDRVGAWPWKRPPRTTADASSAVIDTLVNTAEHLSRSRVGALIALRGEEPWARSIRGGTRLNGDVSQPLLESIFDHHSAGHDGAVLIECGRITRFASHLPLSANHDVLGRHGTRHAAAVGLSEACDGLVLVVSEETGGISVAENGALSAIDSASDLHERLAHYHARHDRTARQRRFGWRNQSLQNAVVAVAVAISLWFAFARQTDTAVRTLTAPIELRGLAPTLAVDEVSDKEAEITLEGPTRAFDLLGEGDLVVVVDLGDLTPGSHVIDVGQDQLDLPSDMSLSRIVPDVLRLAITKAPPPDEN